MHETAHAVSNFMDKII